MFGSPVVEVTATAAGGWSRIVAVLSARTPAGKEIVVGGGGVPTRAGRATYRIALTDQATFLPKGSRLTLTIGSSSLAQSPGNLLYLDLPFASTRPPPRDAAAPCGSPSSRRRSRDEAPRCSSRSPRSSSATAAGAAGTAEPGLSTTTILIGGTVPLSGEAAAFGTVGPGAKAYFDYVNSKGGVNGRKIEYRYYDDGYNPAQTVQLTRQLVEQDRVFAIFNAIGTANNLAIRDYLNAQKVPHLFAGDGSQALGGGSARYPWTVGFLPSYQGEGSVLGRDVVRTAPRARVGVLYENTELGKDMTRGLSRALAGKSPTDRRVRGLRADRRRTSSRRSRR